MWCLFIFIVLTCVTFSSNQQIAKRKCAEYTKISRMLAIDRDFDSIECCKYNTSVYESPHMVTLGFGNEKSFTWLCGGALISENFVVTAAHCTTHPEMGLVQAIRVGTRKLPHGVLARVILVDEIIIHPDFREPVKYNDIALLKLDTSLKFSEAILPACLNTKFDIRSRTSKLIQTIYNDKEDEIEEVELNLFTDNSCKNKYLNYNIQQLPRGIEKNLQICAGLGTKRSICKGESGGPLSMKVGLMHRLVGISTLELTCKIASTPEVFVRISNYVPWIESIVWEY